MALDKVAMDAMRALLRDDIRREIEIELNRILSPTFRDTITKGSKELESIFDAVLGMDDKYDELKAEMDVQRALLEKLHEDCTGKKLKSKQ